MTRRAGALSLSERILGTMTLPRTNVADSNSCSPIPAFDGRSTTAARVGQLLCIRELLSGASAVPSS